MLQNAFLASGIWLFLLIGLLAFLIAPRQVISAFQSPVGWVVLLVLTLPLDQFQFGGTWNLRIWNILLVAAGLALAIQAIRGRAIILGRLAPALALMLVVSLASFFNSAYIADSLRQLIKFVSVSLLIYLVVVNWVTSLETVETVFKTWILTSCIVALWGIVQLGAWVLFQVNWMTVLSYRPPAWFSEATWYGEYLTFGLALTLPFVIVRKRKQEIPWLWMAVGLQIFGIFLSATRTAWIALGAIAISIIILIVIYRRISRAIAMRWALRSTQALSLMMLVLVFGFVLTSYLFPLISVFTVTIGSSAYTTARLALNDASVMGRIESTRVTMIAALQHPMLGNGIGTWGRAFMGQFEGAVALGGSHFNIFIGPFYDAGLFGLAAMFLLLGMYSVLVFKTFRRSGSDPRFLRIAWACLLSFVSTLAISQLNPWYLTGYAWMGIALGAAAWNAIHRTSVSESAVGKDD